MKICLLAPDVNPPFIEGGRRTISDLAEKFLSKGHEVHIVTTQPYSDKGKSLPKEENFNGIHIHRANVWPIIAPNSRFSPSHILVHTALWLRAMSVIKKNNFDIVHGFSAAPALAMRTALAKKFGVPCVHTIDSINYVPFGIIPVHGFLKKIDMVIATTKFLYNKYKESLPKLSLVPYGVDLQRYKKIACPKTSDLLYVGHFYKEKGVEYLIKAMPQILEEIPGAKLTLAWSGIGDRQPVDSLIKSLKLEKSVKIIGIVNDLPKLYSSAKVFVSPLTLTSHTVGHPLTILEAMACGTPVVATDTLGSKEIISDSEDGLLVKRRDSADIADAVIKLLRGTELRRKLAGNCRKKVEQGFDLEKQCSKILKIYSDVCNG